MLALSFAGSAALVGFLALEDGGYDVVVRQEVFLVVWWGLAVAVAFAWLPRARPAAAHRLSVVGFAGLVAVGVAATSWTASDEQTLAELARLLGYGGVVALAWTALGPGSWRAAAAGLFVAAATICAVAVASRLSPNILPLDPIERALASQRLFQPLGYWNALAAFAAATAAMGLAWSADGRRTATRAAALAVTPVATVCLYLTYSRGGVVELIVGVASVLYLCRNRHRAAGHLLALALASFAVILVVRSQPQIAAGTGTEGAPIVAVATLLAAGACWGVARSTRGLSRSRTERKPAPGRRTGDRRGMRIAMTLSALLVALLVVRVLLAERDGFEAAGSHALRPTGDPAARLTTVAGNRAAYWSEALRAFADEPLRGSGPGTFRYGWARYGSEPDLVIDAHSLPLETLAEQGLIGALSLALAFLGVAVVASRGLRAARGNAAASAMASTFAVYLVAASIDWMWEVTAVTVLGLGAAGVLGAAASTRVAHHGAQGSHARRPRLLVLLVFAIAAGVTQLPGVVATERVRDSARLLETGDLDRAREAADDAITATPWASSPYAIRAKVELRAGRLSAARDDAIEAVERERLEPRHRVLLGTIARASGDEAEAERQLRRAQALAPGVEWRLGTGGSGNPR